MINMGYNAKVPDVIHLLKSLFPDIINNPYFSNRYKDIQNSIKENNWYI